MSSLLLEKGKRNNYIEFVIVLPWNSKACARFLQV